MGDAAVARMNWEGESKTDHLKERKWISGGEELHCGLTVIMIG